MIKYIATAAAVGYAAKKGYTKKLGKAAAVTGALFFASGLGIAGFEAFRNTSTLGEFLGAVGQTTMAGAQGLLGSIGIGSGVSETLAGQLGIDPGARLFGQTGTGQGSVLSSVTGAGGSQDTSVKSRVLDNAFGGIASEDIRKLQNRQLLMSGIQAGAQMYLAHRQHNREEKQRARLNFFGGPARGGDSELSFSVPNFGFNRDASHPDDIAGTASSVSAVPPSPFGDNLTPGFLRGST